MNEKEKEELKAVLLEFVKDLKIYVGQTEVIIKHKDEVSKRGPAFIYRKKKGEG